MTLIQAISSLLFGADPDENPDLAWPNRLRGVAAALQRVAYKQGLLPTYLPCYRHTWFQLGVCTYKQWAMVAYWSGSAMLTASQDRHKLLMKDTHPYSVALTAPFGLEVFRKGTLSSLESNKKRQSDKMYLPYSTTNVLHILTGGCC